MHPLYINDDDLDEDMQIAAMEQGSHPHPPTWRCHAPPGALTTVVWSGFYSNIGVSGVLERKAVWFQADGADNTLGPVWSYKMLGEYLVWLP